jgi:hypothetical protein
MNPGYGFPLADRRKKDEHELSKREDRFYPLVMLHQFFTKFISITLTTKHSRRNTNFSS